MRKTIILTILLCTIIFLNFVNAQTSNKIKLLGVAVQGNKTLSENSIKVQSGLIEGKEITREAIPDAIKRLWELRVFADIKILMDKSTDAGLFIIVQVEEYPRLGEYELDGNKKIGKTKINEEIFLLSGKVLSPNLISECKRKIKELYKTDGYLLVEVEEELRDGKKENTKDLILHIKENKKVRIDEINFSGNENFKDGKLRRVMKDTHQRFLLFFRIGEYEKEKYEDDKKLLKAFYRMEGYRDFEILSDTIVYSENKKRMSININVDEGPRYKFRSISISGNTLYSDDQLLNLLGLNPGDWYNEQELQIGMYERINALYMDQGYLYFQIVPNEIPVGENEVDLNLDITENHQVSIGQIHIVGNDKTHENVIRRELKSYPGTIFSRESLIRSQRELMILNYFAKAEPEIIPVDEDEVDIEFNVEEKSADRANLSVSISQLYGLIGGGGVEFNNFLGRGQQLQISYRQGAQYSMEYMNTGSAPYKSINFGFTEPWLFDTPNLVGLNFFYSERGGSSYSYYYPFDMNMMGASVRWGRRFKWPDNFFRGSWRFGITKKEYKVQDESFLNEILFGQPKTNGVYVSQTISRDSRDMPEFPTTGSVLNWTTTYSGGILGGNENYHKHRFIMEFYTPTFWKFVILNHMEFGLIQPFHKGEMIPPDERFIMGGAGMIYGTELRGYTENRVGPIHASTGRPYGGQAMLKYTAEFRIPISPNPTIYALAFAEAGNSWDKLASTDPFNLKRSAGVGVRFFMPQIGMIGVDLGYGFDNIDDVNMEGYGQPEGWDTHFIFGMPF